MSWTQIHMQLASSKCHKQPSQSVNWPPRNYNKEIRETKNKDKK
jgi:hypothetical protein